MLQIGWSYLENGKQGKKFKFMGLEDMGDIKWISIATDIFNNEKIIAIESLPDGKSIEIVWFKLLCLAGTCNENGFLMINQNLPYTDEMMANYFRMDIGIIQRALALFQEMEMIEVVDNIYMVSNWVKYQNATELERIKELHRLRQQKYRDRQKLALEKKGDVTRDAKSDEFCSICNLSYVDVYKDIINYLNNKIGTNYKYTSKKTQTLIHARTEEGFTIEDFKTVIDKKAAEWLGTDMAQYLRPETLFGTKFEGYLNQKEKETRKTDWSKIQ